jgi:hypothetical protein
MTTKSGISWQEHESIRQVELPNGRKFEIYSREGANDFVDSVGNFISTNLTATNDEELAIAYLILITVIDYASPEKIAAVFSESELRSFVEHTRDTLDTLSTDRNWLRSGTMSKSNELLLCTVGAFSWHPSFLKIFISDEGMESVAKFYASRKKSGTPASLHVVGLIVKLVENALNVLELDREKAFGTLEKTGLLGQFIRCVPVAPKRSAKFVTSLQMCLQLVKKKLKSGTRTGDILDAVIAGEDGPINEKAKIALTRLQSLARFSNNDIANKLKMCAHCDKFETLDGAKHMKCQRCKLSYYCSKDCQVSDWKKHKKSCNELGSGIVSRSAFKTSKFTLWAFVKSNYFDIVKEVYKKMQECNVPKKDILVEVDFRGDAPALRNEFTVWLTSDILEESALVDVPAWLRADSIKKTFALFLKEEYEQEIGDELLVVCRAGNAVVTPNLLGLPVANAGYQLLSDEAVDSIGREDYVRMVACLGQNITNRYFDKKSGLI